MKHFGVVNNIISQLSTGFVKTEKGIQRKCQLPYPKMCFQLYDVIRRSQK